MNNKFLKIFIKVLQFGKNYAIIGAVNTEARVDLTKFTLSLISRQLRKGWSLALKSSKGIVSLVAPIADRVAAQLGYFVWDIDYVKEGTEWFLRIDIDKEGGVGIEDCERYSRAIDPILDEENPIEDQYTLQISSPGIEREIKNDFHLEHCLGETVQVRLYAPLNGFKEYVGELKSYNSESVTLDVEEIIEIPRKAIGKMNIYFEF